MIYGWITERFVADFLPLLILSSMIGLIELWRWVPGRSKKIRAGLVAGTILLAMVGVLANLGYSVTPDRSWSHTQLTSYLHAQQDLSDITGHPLNHTIVTGDNFPRPATLGTLFIPGNCQALDVALETVPKSLTPLSIPSLAWMLVERAPQTSLLSLSARWHARSVRMRRGRVTGRKRSRVRAARDRSSNPAGSPPPRRAASRRDRSEASGSPAAQATAPPVTFSAVHPASLSAWAAEAERAPTWHATTTVTSRASRPPDRPAGPSGMFTPIG